MSGVIDSFGDPDQSRTSRAFTTTAHLFPPVAVAVLTVNLANDVVSGFLPSWAQWIVTGFYAVVFLSAVLHHALARICLRCMQDVPADASAQAARRRWLLWADHHYMRVLLVYLALALATRLVGDHTGIAQAHASPLYIPADLVLFVQVAGIWTHHRLRPWCPYCKPWDDEGPRESVPTPDPSGVKTS